MIPPIGHFFSPSKECLKLSMGIVYLELSVSTFKKSFDAGISLLFHPCLFTCFMNSKWWSKNITGLGVRRLASSPGSATDQLAYPGQITPLLWASVSSSVQWEDDKKRSVFPQIHALIFLYVFRVQLHLSKSMLVALKVFTSYWTGTLHSFPA